MLLLPNKILQFLCGVFLLLLACQPANAQVLPLDPESSGNAGYYNRPDSLFLDLKQQYSEALRLKQPTRQTELLNRMAALCFHMGHYGQALEYYLQVASLLQSAAGSHDLAMNSIDLGTLYYYNRDTSAAEQYFRQALSLFSRRQDHDGIALSLGSLGFILEKRKQYDSAIRYQFRALNEYHYSNTPGGLAKIYENLGSIHEDLEQYDSAMYYFRVSLTHYNQSGERLRYLEVLNNIGDIYRKTGNYTAGLNFSRQAADGSRTLNDPYQLSAAYRDLAKTFNLLGRNDSAYHYLELSRKALLDIYSQENSRQTAFLQAQYDMQKRNTRIEQLQHAHRTNRIITIAITIIILLLLVLGALLLNRQQLKIQSERQQNEQQQRILASRNQLMDLELKAGKMEEEKLKSQLDTQQLEREKLDAELRHKALEESLLKDQIEIKTKELSTHALHVIRKNQLLEQLREQLEQLVQEDKRDIKKPMKQLLTLINQSFNNDSYWEEFRSTFEQVHQSFFARLREVCPELSSTELRLVSLLKMNMSSGDMAALLGISPDSLRVARHRLRKKLNLEQGGNLSAFLQQL